MINFIVWIVFGALVGWVASLIAGTDSSMGALGNIIVGIVGSFIGGFIARNLGAQGVTGFNMMSFVVALGGAVLLIFVIRILT